MFRKNYESKSKFPDDFLRVNIKTLRLCGLWNRFGPERKEKILYTLFSVILSYVFLNHILTQIVFIIYNIQNFAIVIATSSVIVVYTTLLLKRILYLLVNQRVYRLVDKLRDGELSPSNNWTQEQTEMAKNYDRRVRITSWSYYWLGIICLCFFTSSGMLNSSENEVEFMNTTATSKLNLPYNTVIFPFDVQKHGFYEFALLLQMLLILFAPTSNIGMDTMFVALVIHASGQIKILKLSLRKIKERAIRMVVQELKDRNEANKISFTLKLLNHLQSMNDPFRLQEQDELNNLNTDISKTVNKASITEDLTVIESFNREFDEHNLEAIQYKTDEDQNYLRDLLQIKLSMSLNDCIRHHQEIAKFTRELEDVFNPIALIQFLSSSVSLCLITFTIAVSDANGFEFFTYIIFLAISILQLLLYCWFGSELTYQVDSLVAAIYDTPWYECSLDFQQNIHTMLIRAMKPFILTGGKIYLMNLDTFLTMMKASFSYYTMLKEMDVS